MFGPVPALHTLAQLGVQEVTLHLVDKEYVEWLKMASEHPAKPSTGISTLPHAIDFESIWAEWEIRVRAVSNGLSPELVWEPHIDMVRVRPLLQWEQTARCHSPLRPKQRFPFHSGARLGIGCGGGGSA